MARARRRTTVWEAIAAGGVVAAFEFLRRHTEHRDDHRLPGTERDCCGRIDVVHADRPQDEQWRKRRAQTLRRFGTALNHRHPGY